MFTFFLRCYREMGLDFSGTENLPIEFDPNSPNGKLTIKKFENGEFKNKVIKTKHPYIVFGVIKGKKSWGLHVKMWSEGICEGSFSPREILKDFEDKGVKIPDSFYDDFWNQIIKRMKT